MLVSAGKRPGGLLQECLKVASSDIVSLTVRRSIHVSESRCSADPSPLETTASMQESQTSAEQIIRGRSSGSSSQRRGGDGPLPEYPDWRRGKAKAFEETPRGQGPFWLGSTPFPLNPSFQPPPPVLHAVRETMWKLHKADMSKNSVRSLSGRFGIPMDRVVAVLRLMALEDEFQKEGKALQRPFQQEMDRLLGAQAKPEVLRREQASLRSNAGSSGLRGPIFEGVTATNSAAEGQPSAIAAALQAENNERQERIKAMRTGGPALDGDALAITETGKAVRPNRPPIAFVDVSNRSGSYSGVGKLRRNVKRAEQKKANMLKRRENDPAWQRRHEISLMLKGGERSPEVLAEKKKLDEEKVQNDALLLAERLKRYKSNRKFKAAMKIARGQAALKKVQAHVERDQSPTVVL